MSEIILGVVTLLGKLADIYQTGNLRKHVDNMARLNKDILKEKEAGYFSDDERISKLEKELKIELEAYQNEILLTLAARK